MTTWLSLNTVTERNNDENIYGTCESKNTHKNQSKTYNAKHKFNFRLFTLQPLPINRQKHDVPSVSAAATPARHVATAVTTVAAIAVRRCGCKGRRSRRHPASTSPPASTATSVCRRDTGLVGALRYDLCACTIMFVLSLCVYVYQVLCAYRYSEIQHTNTGCWAKTFATARKKTVKLHICSQWTNDSYRVIQNTSMIL